MRTRLLVLLATVCVVLSIASRSYAQGGGELYQSTNTQVNIIATSISTGLAITTGSVPSGFSMFLIKHADSGAPTVTTWTPTNSGTSAHDCFTTAGSDEWTCEITATDTGTLGRTDICWRYPGAFTLCDRYTVVPVQYTAGYPVVTVKDGTGTGEIDTASGAAQNVTVATVNTGAVTAASLATDTVTAAKIAAAAITSSEAPNLDAAVSTRGISAVKKNTAFEWGMRFFDSSGNPVTTGTPSCTRSIDSVSAFSATANTPSAVTAAGRSELTVAAADINGNYYMWLVCSLSGALDYETEFKIQQE